MLTTFSMYAYVSIIMSGAVAFAALKTAKEGGDTRIAIQVKDVSADPDRSAASSDSAD